MRVLQMLRYSPGSAFLRSFTDQPTDFPVQLHLRQHDAHSAVNGLEQFAVVDFFSDVHVFPLSGAVRLIFYLPFFTAKENAIIATALSFTVNYITCTICSYSSTNLSPIFLMRIKSRDNVRRKRQQFCRKYGRASRQKSEPWKQIGYWFGC